MKSYHKKTSGMLHFLTVFFRKKIEGEEVLKRMERWIESLFLCNTLTKRRLCEPIEAAQSIEERHGFLKNIVHRHSIVFHDKYVHHVL